MKLKKDIETEREELINIKHKAKKSNDIELVNMCEGAMMALDWVLTSRNEDWVFPITLDMIKKNQSFEF